MLNLNLVKTQDICLQQLKDIEEHITQLLEKSIRKLQDVTGLYKSKRVLTRVKQTKNTKNKCSAYTFIG